MRFVMILVALAACTDGQPFEPTPIGPSGGGGGGHPTCAPDPLPARSSIDVLGGYPLWTRQSISVEAEWTQSCSGLVECPWLGNGDTPIYETCHIPGIATTLTAMDATVAKESKTTADRRVDTYTITPTHAGSVAMHVSLTNTDTGETAAKDATVVVRDLEDLRFRCIIGPDLSTAVPCPDPIPAGSEIGVIVDGRAADRYDYVPAAVTFSSGDQHGCSGDQVGDDDHYSELCILEGVTQPLTVTATAFGVTRTATLSVQ